MPSRETGFGGGIGKVDEDDFPGCDPVSMTWEDVLAHKGRKITYWDGDAQTAWVVRDTSPVAEQMAARLSGLMGRVAEERGAPIEAVNNPYIIELVQDDDEAGLDDAYRAGLREGHASGLREGYLISLRRIASRKFDAEFVSRLLHRLNQVERMDTLTEVTALVVDSTDAHELERRLAETLR